MALRKVQDLLRTDPRYSQSFEANATVSPAEPPSRVTRESQSQDGHPSPGSKEAQASATANEPARSEPPAAAQVELSKQPAPQPTPKARKEADAPSQGQRPVSFRLHPLKTQVERIDAAGMEPRVIMRAAWRQAVASCTVQPTFIEPSKAEQVTSRTYLFDSTLNVDAEVVAKLAREHDRLGVKGHWWLIRGQLEPAFWTALDAVLDQLAEPSPS